MEMVDWKSIFGFSYNKAYESFKASVGAEIVSELLSIPDTIAFIEFIYEEAAQQALFAIYNAYKAGDYDTAFDILNYLKFELFPDAVNMIGGWGKLNPATQTCFERFFDAVEKAINTWEKIIAVGPPQQAVLVIYTSEDDVTIKVDGEIKGFAGEVNPLKLTLEPGGHSIEASKSGFETEVRQVSLDPGEYRAIKINMKPTS